MEQQVKEDWIINDKNIFGFSQDINLPLFSIQYNILCQLKNIKISSISDYLGAKIDTTQEMRFAKTLTIQKVLKDLLSFDPFKQSAFNCSIILSYLQQFLFKEYSRESHNNILTFLEYEKQYNSLLDRFLLSNIDTDEQDFIKAELTLCDNLITELDKPIYNVIVFLNEVSDKPCGFKKNLINSIDKRKKFLEQREIETEPKVKALFRFIDFLHSSIKNFKQYDELLKELHNLDIERNKLSPRKNFKDKLEYDKIQAVKKDKFQVIKENIIQPIQDKANELNICDLNKTETLWNWNISEISNLKENFSQRDLSEIFRHKRKYLEYRTETNGEFFFVLSFFFDELDEVLKELFDYFKETEHNEFEAFETKAISVNDISGVVKLFQHGNKKVTLPNSFLNRSHIQKKTNIKPLPPQQIAIQKPESPEPRQGNNTDHSEQIKKLRTIWLADPKITVEDFIQKGIVKGLWNENLNIITARGSLYGTGKTMLGSIFIAFKGWAISNNIDSKKVGIVFCNVFNVDIKKATNEPYKAFSSGNSKTVTEIRRAFGIQNS
jgi:hypothetical protein